MGEIALLAALVPSLLLAWLLGSMQRDGVPEEGSFAWRMDLYNSSALWLAAITERRMSAQEREISRWEDDGGYAS